MNRQQAYERRVWRLAHLLASPDQAVPLVRRVVWRRRGDLDRLDAAHLDRLVILTARELPSGSRVAWANTLAHGESTGTQHRHEYMPVPRPPTLAAELLRHLHSMPRQPMEAWILSRLDDLDLMAASRAMDCSKTATARHLEAADEHLQRQFARAESDANADSASSEVNNVTAATEALRAWLDDLDPAPALARAHREARIRRRVTLALIVLGAIALAAVLASSLT